MNHYLRFLTAGESHGPQITVILDGLPAGLRLDESLLRANMRRRQGGYGRGNRQQIEKDEATLLSGVRFGETTGAPITIAVANRDHDNWREVLQAFGSPPAQRARELTRPRPGHADLVGMLKYAREDARDILERASARETAGRVAAGEIARAFLSAVGVEVFSHVLSIGSARAAIEGIDYDTIRARAEASDVRAAEGAERMKAAIDAAAQAGDSVGGIFEVVARGLPIGLGSSMAPDRKLDARLAFALLSIPAVKGCEFGPAFENAARLGSEVHDEYLPVAGDVPRRLSNRAGGLEGGMTTGEALICRAALKPISTLKRALRSVDMRSNTEQKAAFERSDVCAVPAAGVIGEAVVLLVLADAVLECFGGDTLARVSSRLEDYRAELRTRMRAKEGA